MMETVAVPEVQNVCADQEFNEYMEQEGSKMIWSLIHRYGKGVEKNDAFQECPSPYGGHSVPILPAGA